MMPHSRSWFVVVGVAALFLAALILRPSTDDLSQNERATEQVVEKGGSAPGSNADASLGSAGNPPGGVESSGWNPWAHLERLDAQVREIYFLERNLRDELVGALSARGPQAAFDVAIRWIGENGSTLNERLRRLIAIRALPGLAGAVGSTEAKEWALALVIQQLADADSEMACRDEALDALIGGPFCLVRDAESLARINNSCSAHIFDGKMDDCPKDDLVDGSLAGLLGPDPRIINTLERLVLEGATKRTGLTESALISLNELDEERGASSLTNRLTSIEQVEPGVSPEDQEAATKSGWPSHTWRLAWSTANLALKQLDPASEGFKSVLMFGATSSSIDVRMGILQAALGARNGGWTEEPPDMASYIQGTVEFMEAGGVDASPHRAGMARGVLQLFEQLWGMNNFVPTVDEKEENLAFLDRHRGRLAATLPAYTKIIDYLLESSDPRLDLVFEGHIESIDYDAQFSWSINDHPFEARSEDILGYHLVSILKSRPGSERALRLLSVIENSRRE